MDGDVDYRRWHVGGQKMKGVLMSLALESGSYVIILIGPT